MHQRMKFPAPVRCSNELRGGKYCTKPWAVEDVKQYLAVGGWFFPGKHDFANREAASAAAAGSIL